MTAAPHSANSTRSVWLLILGVSALIGLAAMVAWLWQTGDAPSQTSPRPAPVYLRLEKIDAKTSDGGMLAIKVGLQLEKRDDQKSLLPYAPVFKDMIMEMTAELSHKDLLHPGGMEEMSGYVEYTLNEYLTQQGMSQRINSVMFEEWLLLM